MSTEKLTLDAKKEIVRKLWRLHNNNDSDGALALLAPDFKAYSSTRPEPADRKTFLMTIGMFNQAISDIHDEIIKFVAEGDYVVAEMIETGKWTGPLDFPGKSLPPTNQSYEIPMVELIRFNHEGLIAEIRNYYDTNSLTHQIGLDLKEFESLGNEKGIQSSSMLTPKEIVTKFWHAWSEHNLEDMLSFLALDFVKGSPGLGPDVDKDTVAQAFMMFDKALPDLKETIINIIEDVDIVSCEMLETATFTGPMDLGSGTIEPTNRSYKLPFASFFRVNSQGLIAEQRTYFDIHDWFKQIGIDEKVLGPRQ